MDKTTTISILPNMENYGEYEKLIKTGTIIIDTSIFTSSKVLDDHFYWILNILRDGIETETVQNMAIKVIFADKEEVILSVFDYFFNLIMWNFAVVIGKPITSKYLFFEDAITKNSIKKYIDTNFLNDDVIASYTNIQLNNIIDYTIYKFKYIDEFSLYLLNTINNEDTIMLMKEDPEFWECIHCDMSGVPIEQVKNKGMEYTNKAVSIIKNSDHCLSDFFRSGEGVNPKQFKETTINIGSKPDGNGGVFPAIINSNFSNGGVNDVMSYFIESSVGRIAQILQRMNVGKSGDFARLLQLNNMDLRLHPDPNYTCDTKNFQKVFIKDSSILNMFSTGRYYRLTPDGVDKKLDVEKDTHLIGQTVYFRSPMTCASNSRGEGICYKCYGDLAYTNSDINIGTIAAEILSSKLTQMLLSAKHLLESAVRALKWSKGFSDIFEVNFNIVKINDGFDCKKCKVLIEYDNIYLEDEYDDYEYNEYINVFTVLLANGEEIKIYTEDSDNIYITKELNEYIHSLGEPNEGGVFELDMEDIKDMNLFLVHINNNELSRTLNKLKDILNKDAITRGPGMTRDKLLQMFIETCIEGKLFIKSIHCEAILANQLRSVDNIIELPQWEYPNEPCEILTLNKSLTNHPSIITSLSYQKLSKLLYNPLSFKKKKPSTMDLFFMKKPQEYMNKDVEETYVKYDKDKEELTSPFIYDED